MKLNRITSVLMLSSMPFLANSASYEVIELPTKDLSVNQFGSAIDETSLMLTTVTQPFNPPIDLTYLDLSAFVLTDPDEAANGNFNDDDYNLIGSYIYSQTVNSSLFGQKLASQIGYQSDGTDFSYVNGFDTGSQGTDGFTFAQTTSFGDSVNGTHIVGTMGGPFNDVSYVNEEGTEFLFTVSDFGTRGFVQVGDNVVELPPQEISAGGVSSAEAINDNLQIVGTMGVRLNATYETLVASCIDDELRGDQPLEVCLFSLRSSASRPASQFLASTERRAVIWQVDNSGELLDKTVYGLSFVPDADITALLSTQGTAINNFGVAVGTTTVPLSTSFTTAAAVFEDGETIRLIEDDDLLPNLATGINDNGYVVGYQSQRVGTVSRAKMFVINRNTDNLIFSDGFFINSSTFPRAINNNNIVVGEGEIEGGQSTRRRSGFLYDIDADTFSNINNLIACDSTYDIVAVNDINDSNEMIGNALVQRPIRNLRGNVVTDINGDEVLVDIVVAVKLVPTGDAPSDCDNTGESTNAIERQGASVGILTILGLLMLSLIRRREKTL